MTDEFIIRATLDPPGGSSVVGTTPIGSKPPCYGRCLVRRDPDRRGPCVGEPGETNPATVGIGPTFQNDCSTLLVERQRSRSVTTRRDADDPIGVVRRSLCPRSPLQRDDIRSTLPITMRQWIRGRVARVVEHGFCCGTCFPNTFVDSDETRPWLDEEQQPERFIART